MPNPTVKQPTICSADDAISNFQQVNWLKITPNQAGQRLDNFLFARLKGLPKSHVYKLIRSGEIRINKGRAKAAAKLKLGDVVRIAPIRLSTPAQPKVGSAVADMLLARILYEDEGLIVLNKPAGMAVHGGSGQSYGVIEALRLATQKKYLELIHRIDKETSGILLISKKRSTLKQIQAAFREKTVKKQYQALVHGVPNFTRTKVDKPLKRFTLANGERRVKIHSEGKASLTDIEVLASYQHAALLLAKPHTGRTHQIRVHCQSLGHALLGDEKYSANHSESSQISASRLCLHAWKISVPNIGDFEAPVPEDMTQLKQAMQTNNTNKDCKQKVPADKLTAK